MQDEIRLNISGCCRAPGNQPLLTNDASFLRDDVVYAARTAKAGQSDRKNLVCIWRQLSPETDVECTYHACSYISCLLANCSECDLDENVITSPSLTLSDIKCLCLSTAHWLAANCRPLFGDRNRISVLFCKTCYGFRQFYLYGKKTRFLALTSNV